MRRAKNNKQYPISFKTEEFSVLLVGEEGSKKLGYIRLENKDGEYVGSFDRDEKLPGLVLLRDALTKIIEENS